MSTTTFGAGCDDCGKVLDQSARPLQWNGKSVCEGCYQAAQFNSTGAMFAALFIGSVLLLGVVALIAGLWMQSPAVLIIAVLLWILGTLIAINGNIRQLKKRR